MKNYKVTVTWLHKCLYCFIIRHMAVFRINSLHSVSWSKVMIIQLSLIREFCFPKLRSAVYLGFSSHLGFLWLLKPWSAKNLQSLYVMPLVKRYIFKTCKHQVYHVKGIISKQRKTKHHSYNQKRKKLARKARHIGT